MTKIKNQDLEKVIEFFDRLFNCVLTPELAIKIYDFKELVMEAFNKYCEFRLAMERKCLVFDEKTNLPKKSDTSPILFVSDAHEKEYVAVINEKINGYSEIDYEIILRVEDLAACGLMPSEYGLIKNYFSGSNSES